MKLPTKLSISMHRLCFRLLAAMAFVCYATACEEEPEQGPAPYVNITSVDFTFNVENTKSNVIKVESNTSWLVRFTPSDGVRSNVLGGNGDGSFYLKEMHDGTTVEIVVYHTLPSGEEVVSQKVLATRGSVTPTLTLAPEALTFSTNADNNQITVTSNTAWSATASNPALKFTPTSGRGNGNIAVTDMAQGETYTLTVMAGTGDSPLVKTVEVTRGAAGAARQLYYDNFDGAVLNNVWANETLTWKNSKGEGAGAIEYTPSKVMVQTNASTPSYAEASGKNYMNLNTDYNAYFIVNNIAVTGEQRFTLSLGGNFTSADCTISVCGDKRIWKPLSYTAAASGWKMVSIDFTLTETTNKLSIMITPAATTQAWFDDLKLTTSAGGTSVDLTNPAYANRWVELPAAHNNMSDKRIHTYWAETVASKQPVRNYTYCYDIARHCPLWIAHPQHRCYQESSGRTDKWLKDEFMTHQEQAILYPLTEVEGGNRALSLYTKSASLDIQWTRGHMLMSNYRGGENKLLNAQTFIASNIAPQGGTAFEKIWKAAETKIMDAYVCADTLYCVSGAYFENNNTVARDASYWMVSERNYVPSYSKECIVPTHYYKLILRTKNGNTGKPIQQCQPSELKAVGFWFEHANEIGGSTSPVLGAAYMKSVEWIEQQTGFSFFPEVDASVKANFTAADWGY